MTKRMVASIVLTVFVILLILIIVGLASSMDMEIENFDNPSFPQLANLKIVHLSDIHYPNNGIKLASLVAEINYLSPHIILISGDTFDKSATAQDITNLKEFFTKLSSIARTFAVIGNHEIGSAYLDNYNAICQQSGVVLLNNQIVYYDYAQTKIAIIGLKDGYSYNEKNLPKLSSVNEEYTKILVAHRCEKFDNYANADYKPDLVFAGHAHGGQVRFASCGLYAPNQGFFPKYTSGKYQQNGCTMYVSRGLGESQNNLRWFNKYHLITVKL